MIKIITQFMARRRRMRIVTGTSIHIDDWLYIGSTELMNTITNLSGQTDYQNPLLTLSDTILTLVSYSIQFEDLPSKGEKTLLGLLDAANRKTPAITVSINYSDRFKYVIDSLMTKYKVIGTKISFGEAVRVALYSAISRYNKEPEKILLPLMLLVSLSNPVLTNKEDYERIEDITTFTVPSFEPSMKEGLKEYYKRIPNYFVDSVLDKGRSGQISIGYLALEMAKIELSSPSAYKETKEERLSDSVNSSGSEVAAMGYVLCAVWSKYTNDTLLRETFRSAENLDQLSSVHSTVQESFSAYSLILMMLIYHSSLIREIKTTIAEKVRPFYLNVLDKFFSD
jgi:hypothetical protein